MVEKKPIAANGLAEIDMAYMYYLRSQPWLPHYTEKNVYVAPGGQERPEKELLALGAVKKEVALWIRHWQKR